VEQLGFSPIGLKSSAILGRLLAFLSCSDSDASAIHRHSASFPLNTLCREDQVGLLGVAGFVGKMVGESTQGLYVNGPTALIENENSFFEGTQRRGQLCDVACG